MALESWNSSDVTRSVADSNDRLDDLSVVLENLSLLSSENALLLRRRIAQIRELVSLLFDSSDSLTRDTFSDLIEKKLLPTLRTSSDDASETELILLCKELVKLGTPTFLSQVDELLGHTETIPAKASEKVAYLQNRFTDAAFLKLTAHLSRPRAAYFSSFADACEEVYHGLCEYCILPVESTADGKLLRFYTLIEKYDLKIVAVYDTEASDGGYTRYALLRHKAISSTFPKRLYGERFAEFTIILNERSSLSAILHAAELCHMHLLQINSLPLAYKDGAYRYDLVFALSPDTSSNKLGEDTEAFLLYLTYSLSEYTPLGFYTKIL